MKIKLVTTNTMKFQIAQAYFDKLGGDYELTQYAVETPEIQDTSVIRIAAESALWAARKSGEPCIKLDVGCFIKSLNGFPGPFVKFVNDYLTQEDFMQLLANKSDRSAYFEDALAIAYPNGETKVFSRREYGTIADYTDSKNTKWPMNSLFIPDSHDCTLARMTDEEQISYWGDGNWPQMIEYLKTQANKETN